MFLSLFQEGARIDRCRVLAHFEMQLGRVGASTHARKSDLLSPLHLLAALDFYCRRMTIYGHKPVLVAHQHGIAEFLQSVAGINDNSVLGSLDGCSFRYGNVDAIATTAERRNDAAPHGPAHLADACRVRSLDLILGCLLDDFLGLLWRCVGSQGFRRRRLWLRRGRRRPDGIELS